VLLNCVSRACAFHKTTLVHVKFDPDTCRVMGPLPVNADVGAIAVATGTGPLTVSGRLPELPTPGVVTVT
jgi:hypothetical protein